MSPLHSTQFSRAPSQQWWVPTVVQCAAAALFGDFSPFAHQSPPQAYTWSLSRKARNRLLHALHGNPPALDTDKKLAGQEVRRLQELQPLGRLRSMGWTVPPCMADTDMVRVYDTRLERSWLDGLLPDLDIGAATSNTVLVGGDFLTEPHVEDGIALHPGRLQRWGPPEPREYNLLVLPRPHQQTWVERAHKQLGLEAAGSWLCMLFIVPREACPAMLTEAALCRLVPSLTSVLGDAALEVRAVAVGERPAVVRVPAGIRILPPPQWEPGYLPLSRVLLAVSFRRHSGLKPPFHGRWVRGTAPKTPISPLELLRVELPVPPATRAAAAEQRLRAAVRRAAEAVGVPVPPTHQLRQVQAAHGTVLALLSVPKEVARQWLRASGCNGLLVRPFWTPQTGKEVDRSQFNLVWLRRCAAPLEQLWTSLSSQPGFFGLVSDGNDIALRVSADADLYALQLQVQFVVKDEKASLHRPISGQRWWRLGPLTDAEAWRAAELVAATGLTPLRRELRFGRAGPFRQYVYFAAVGEPSRRQLDDGSWSATMAQLSPAAPPSPTCTQPVPSCPQTTAVLNWSSPKPTIYLGWAPPGSLSLGDTCQLSRPFSHRACNLSSIGHLGHPHSVGTVSYGYGGS